MREWPDSRALRHGQSYRRGRERSLEEFYVFVTHPIFSEKSSEFLQNSIITKVIVTDSVFVPEEKQFPKLEILSVAEDVARVIKEV